MADTLHTTAPAARAAEISEATLRLWLGGIVPSQVTSQRHAAVLARGCAPVRPGSGASRIRPKGLRAAA